MALISAALLPLVQIAEADPTPSTAPAPLLDEISRETQNLYQSVRPGLVLVELPPPKWVTSLNDANNPMQKWDAVLEQDVRKKLQDATAGAANGQPVGIDAFVTNQPPTSQPANSTTEQAQPSSGVSGGGAHTLMIHRPDGGVEYITPGSPAYDAVVSRIVGPRFLGIILDDSGHVLVPMFIDKDALVDFKLRAFDTTGKAVQARLIGADRQTNLSVIQLQTSIGKPLTIAGAKPRDGSLVMVLSPNGDSCHLSVWTGNEQDRGLVIATNGSIAGFVRAGQFLGGEGMLPIADELIQYGKIRRATLGVLISQTETPDGHPAMRVEQVVDQSAAADAGIKVGDFILSLAGSPVGDLPSFAAAIAKRDGQTDLQVLRDGQSITVTASLKPQ